MSVKLWYISMYVLMIGIYFLKRKEGEARGKFLFGVEGKEEWINEVEVQRIRDRYYGNINIIFCILMFLPAITYITKYISIRITIWLLWLFLGIILLSVPYIAANKKLKDWKNLKVYEEQIGKVEVAEVPIQETRIVKAFPFVIPILLSTGIAFYGIFEILGTIYNQFWFLLIEISNVSFFNYLIAVWMDHFRVELISTQKDVNISYAQEKRNIWKKFWLMMAWVNTGYVLVVTFALLSKFYTGKTIILATCIYAAIMLVRIYFLIGRILQLHSKFDTNRDLMMLHDSDRRWMWGKFYDNPDDKKVLISKRNGIGKTVNLSSIRGKVNIIACFAMLILIPVGCIFLMTQEFTPIEISVENQELEMEHLFFHKNIEISDIKDVAVTNRLPEMTRKSGIGMKTVRRGVYQMNDGGECEVLLNPERKQFIYFWYHGMEYYICDYDEVNTFQVYNQLIQMLEEPQTGKE